jgi:hypothetical protein
MSRRFALGVAALAAFLAAAGCSSREGPSFRNCRWAKWPGIR